ncbi:hypothetical protein PUNSTDRAFT_52260 [Punctularia strigosozonata HHB-11173 SS5]|uniref:uncharacterized protein n=1 Tax=Punctularia strigosozonata (strain HHB-11173) TaxID=741275 RepID=UPI0004417FA5|nr:uncharacterized protein PUNSTDRAFT_52260 [Punctularia strigosozonata HHB-11173 SS5]EIN08774.1 hypothetical protein PUNSTDRAFT_52260 [Punctularia strigosozonata HHB-11173 SS5]
MFARLLVASAVAALAGVASADLQVLAPGGPDLWWVAQSVNTILWNCQESQFQNFTILIANSNPTILVQPQAIIAIEENFDCSKTITEQQANFTVASGYTIQLANTLNTTDIYAESQPFEIKSLGSTYPASSATPTATGTSTASGSNSASASGSPTSGSDSSATSKASSASSIQFSGVLALAAAALGLVVA